MGSKCDQEFPDITGVNHVTVDEAWQVSDRVIQLGRAPVVGDPFAKKPERWTPPEGLQVYTAPSQAEVLGTAGGLTKLGYAIHLYLTGAIHGPDFSAPFTRITSEVSTTGLPTGMVDVAVVDIEVSGDISKDEPEDTELISLAVLLPSEVSTVSDGYRIFVWDRSALRSPDRVAELRQLLSSARTLVAHNGKFDFRWINRLLDLNLYPDDDTMCMHHSMFHGAGEHGLKPLAQRIFGAPEWEDGVEQWVGKGKAHYERIPQDVLVKYNAQDVYWTWLLWKRFTDMLAANPAATKAYALEMRLTHMLQDAEKFGMPVDVEYGEYLRGYYEDALDKALPYLHRVAQRELNPNSPKQVKQFFADCGYKIKSTDEDTMTQLRMLNVEVDVCDAILRVRKLVKAQGTYVKGPLSKVRGDGFVHPNFRVTGTSTGRLSCSNPNVQNVPNDDDTEDGVPSSRRLYSAPAGWKFVGCDYSQAELRVIAELSRDATMLYDLRAGAPDFFDNMLPSVWPEIDWSTFSKSQRKPFRLKLKRIVYGLNYGRTAKAIAAALTLEGTPTSEAEAQLIADRYLGRYDGLQAWRASTMTNVRAGDWTTPFGRAFQQDVIIGTGKGRIENQAWAFMPQSIAGDITSTAACNLHDLYRSSGKDIHIVATVHDAIYALARDEYAEWGLEQMAKYMEDSAAALYTGVVFPVDGHIAQNWNDC